MRAEPGAVCASVMIAAGLDIEQVAEQLGHKSSSVTRRVYRHALNLDRRTLAAQLSQAVTTINVEESVQDRGEAAA